ncbi:MAG: DNA-processing protein DprA [Nitriliruptoraceae bacterium]
MSGDRLDPLTREVRPLAAAGTDATTVAALLAWAVRPRRTLEGVRRTLAAQGVRTGDPGDGLLAEVRGRIDGDDVAAALRLVPRWRAQGCRLSVVGDPAYPSRLAEGWPATDGPVLLVTAGTLPPSVPTVAIVGSRNATSYGAGVAAWLAEAASAAGVHVVSGGALGIDAAAHRAAVEGPGGTSVVLGCGHDVGYPRPHARPGGLFERIRSGGGGLVSEQLPGVPPKAGIVRARNRIVAGLADVVVVVEGGRRSGSLLTATAALERGRSVLAVPGDIRRPGSVAPNRLLNEGAGTCTDPSELLHALRSPAGPREVAAVAAPGADGDAVTVLPSAVRQPLVTAWPRAIVQDELIARSGRSPGEVLAALTRAQLAGEVVERADGFVLCRQPAGPPR